MAKSTRLFTVADFAALHAAVEALGPQIVIFRGQRNRDWPLTPKIGRPQHFLKRQPSVEEGNILKLFKERAVPHLGFKRVVTLTIPAASRKQLKHTLYRYGIHRASLFPDLDGTARHIEWLRTDGH